MDQMIPMDNRATITVRICLLVFFTTIMGMALGKLDNGIGTKFTVLAFAVDAVAVAFFLFLLLREIWKREAPRA
jgi:hypothetical protein